MKNKIFIVVGTVAVFLCSYFLVSCDSSKEIVGASCCELGVKAKPVPIDNCCSNSSCDETYVNCGINLCDREGISYQWVCLYRQYGSCRGKGLGNCYSHRCYKCPGIGCRCTIGLCYCRRDSF